MGRYQGLKDVRLFAGCGVDDLEAVRQRAQLRTVGKGHLFFRMGEANRNLFVLTRGAVQVERPGTAEHTLLTTLSPGQTFGEMSFVDGSRATASIVATEPCEALEISHDALEALLGERAELGRSFWRNLALELKARLAETNKLVDHYADIHQVLMDNPSLRDACIRA